MNQKDFFNLIVSESVNHYKDAIKTDLTDAGSDLCVITTDGNLKYITMGEDLMNEVFFKALGGTGEKSYDFRIFSIPKDGVGEVTFVQKVEEELQNGDYILGGFDTMEILVDANDNSKFLIMNEGEEIYNTSSIQANYTGDEYIFSYGSSKLTVTF